MNWRNQFQTDFSGQQFRAPTFEQRSFSKYSTLPRQTFSSGQQNAAKVEDRMPFFIPLNTYQNYQLRHCNMLNASNPCQLAQNVYNNRFCFKPLNDYPHETRFLNSFTATGTHKSFISDVPSQRPRFSQYSCQKDVPRTSDQFLVEQFLLKCGKHMYNTKTCKLVHCHKQDPTNVLKITEANKLHNQAKCLIAKLESYLESTIMTESLPKDILKYKNDLNQLLPIISNKSTLQKLHKKIINRKKKRNRLKKNKQKSYSEKQLYLTQLEKANIMISEWQKNEQAKLNDQLREDELQKQLDEALLEMRHQLSTLLNSLDMVNFLSSLRKLRYSSLKAKDQDLPNQSVSKHFIDTSKEIKLNLLSFKEYLTNRIDSLKSFLETEYNKAKLNIKKRKNRELIEKKQELENQIKFALFGKQRDLDPFHSMWPVQEVHKQADISLVALVQYRRLWDQYLHENGSPIPVFFVDPVKPSCPDWSQYLTESDAIE